MSIRADDLRRFDPTAFDPDTTATPPDAVDEDAQCAETVWEALDWSGGPLSTAQLSRRTGLSWTAVVVGLRCLVLQGRAESPGLGHWVATG
jgi:hypothetical protein